MDTSVTSNELPPREPLADGRHRIHALGTFCVRDAGGEPVREATAQRRPAAVLAVVAAAGDRGIERDGVLRLLWSGADPERARHSLSQALYAIRRATGVDDLILTQGALRLNRARVSTDIDDFQAAAQAGDLVRAERLYGGPFLDGFTVSDSVEFDRWVAAKRARFEEQRALLLYEVPAGRNAHAHAAGRVPGGTEAQAAASPPPMMPWRRRRAVVGGVVAAGLLLAIAGVRAFAWRGPSLTPSVADHSAGVFVAPFDVSGANASVAYLGYGVPRLLSTLLDGADQPSADRPTVDASVAALAWRRAGFDGRHDVPRDSILRLAKQQGAERVVLGSVVGDGTRTVLSATMLTIDGQVLATAAIDGPADNISAEATRLAAKLLIAQAGDTALVTRWDMPLPALRAFLMGRAAYRTGQYVAAARAFDRALQLDSTFALAGLQLARTADRLGDLDQEDAALARTWPHRASLDEPRRAQLVAMAGPSYPLPSAESAQVGVWGIVVRADPARAASWYEMGARLLHDGRRVQREDASAQALLALNHALLIDPAYGPARDLLEHITIRSSDGLQVALRTPSLDSSSTLEPFLHWRAALERGDSATVRNLRSHFAAFSSENLRAIAMASQFDAVGLGDGGRAITVLGQRAVTTAERVDAALAAHSLAMNLGRTADALAQTTRLRDLRPDSHAYLRLRVFDALYGDGDIAAGSEAARTLGAPIDSLFRALPRVGSRVAADACTVAQWRLAHGDTSDVRAIIALLRARDTRRDDQPVSVAPAVCGDLLGATLAVNTGRPDARQRVDRLDRLVLTSAVAGYASQYANIGISRLYAALGYRQQALAALQKRSYMAGWPAYLGATWRAESPLAQAAGNSQRAVTSRRRIAALRTVAMR